jgi:hypothetical protein
MRCVSAGFVIERREFFPPRPRFPPLRRGERPCVLGLPAGTAFVPEAGVLPIGRTAPVPGFRDTRIFGRRRLREKPVDLVFLKLFVLGSID